MGDSDAQAIGRFCTGEQFYAFLIFTFDCTFSFLWGRC